MQIRMLSLSFVRDLHHVTMDGVSVVLDVLDATVRQGDAVLPHHVAVLVPLPVLAVVLQQLQVRSSTSGSTYQVIVRIVNSIGILEWMPFLVVVVAVMSVVMSVVLVMMMRYLVYERVKQKVFPQT